MVRRVGGEVEARQQAAPGGIAVDPADKESTARAALRWQARILSRGAVTPYRGMIGTVALPHPAAIAANILPWMHAVAGLALVLVFLALSATAHAQKRDDIVVELPDKRVVKLGEAKLARSRLKDALDTLERRPNWRNVNFVIYSPSAQFCPRFLAWGTSDWQLTEAEPKCEAWVRSTFARDDAAGLARCKCVKVLEGRANDKYRLLTDVFTAPTSYSTALLVTSRDGVQRTQVRGWAAVDDNQDRPEARPDSVRLFNDKREQVCGGGNWTQETIENIACSGGRGTGKGTYRRLTRREGNGTWNYIVGRIDLSNGERLDFVTVLSEPELKRFHPNFPN